MRMIALLTATCLFAFTAAAQPPKTYAETKREQDWKKYQDDYIEGTRYNRNTPSRSNNNSSDNSAAQALADQWRRNSGRRTAAEQKEWEKGAAAREELRKQKEAAERERWRKLDREIAALNERRAKTEATRKTALDKNIAEYSALGFTAQEADRFAWAITTYPDGSRAPGTDAERAAVQKAVAARRKYNAIKSSGTYDELARLIPDMHAASLTAMQAWQDLALRFPEKREETEQWELWAMPAIFDRHPSDHPAVAYSQEKATERFFELFSRQPAAAIEAVQAFTADYYHPIYSSGMYDKMDTDEGRRWAEVMLLGTNNYSQHNRRDEWRKVMFESSWSAAYWKKKTNADWKALAEIAGISQIAVFERLTSLSRNLLALGGGRKGRLYSNYNLGPTYQFLWDEIADLAAAGEPSCMNAYGFTLASNPKSSGKDRKRGFRLLQQAVDSGVLWAPLNLLFLADAGVEDAPIVDSAFAQVKRFATKASAHQCYQLAYELKRRVEYKSIDPRHAAFASKLALQAAATGHAAAQSLYTRPDWIDIGIKPGTFIEGAWGTKYEGLTIPGQRTVFTNWAAAVKALPHFQQLARDSIGNKDVVSHWLRAGFMVFPRTHDFGSYYGSLNLPDTKLTAYTLKMNFVMVQNPLPDGLFGLTWHGPFQSGPTIYFMVNPAKRQYYFGSGGDGNAYKTYHTSRSFGRGYSDAIKTWNTQYYSTNEIGVERNGNLVKLVINGTVVETVDISPYAKVFENMSHVGYGFGEGKFSACITDFFVSVKE